MMSLCRTMGKNGNIERRSYKFWTTESLSWCSKKENVYFNNCRKFDVEETSVRKRKAPDYFVQIDAEAAEEIIREAPPDDRLICTDGQLTNIFYNAENSSKKCAQGANANLLHMLQCSKEQIDLFWQLANSDVEDLVKNLRLELPKNVTIRLIPLRSVYGY